LAAAGAAGSAGVSPTADGGTTGGIAGGDGIADAAPSIVTVSVNAGSRRPLSNVAILVNDTNGSLLSSSLTAADGRARVAVHLHDSISAVRSNEGTSHKSSTRGGSILTAFDLPDLTDVRFYFPDPELLENAPTDAAPMNLNVTVRTTVSGAHSQEVQIPCNAVVRDRAAPLLASARTPCEGSSTISIFGIVYDVAGEVLSFAPRLDVPFQPGSSSTVYLDAENTSVVTHALHASALPASATDVHFAVGGTPSGAGATLAWTAQSAVPARGELRVRVPGLRFDEMFSLATLSITSATHDLTAGSRRTGITVPAIHDWEVGSVSGVAPESVAIDSGDVSRPGVTWQLQHEEALADVVILRAAWGTAPDQVTWAALTPSSPSTTARLPELPSEFENMKPSSERSLRMTRIEHSDVVGVDGYAAYLREASAEPLLRNGDWAALSPRE
jgi:hypothetical protein